MKTVEVSDSDYARLELFASDKWMSCKGEPPKSIQYVLQRIIDNEYDRFSPPRYRSWYQRED